eukprot:CAMPEP_0184720746 /NCGR_PEP_ID=MMETSP0314-20130426/15111_1 /TAXON_ID=38298 /ORGANISM="Rhodella maculata, Strain CCMP 736" /LENGTH=63 /DNA_ID=CAMNT_0027184927 /DNA_START=87 /DNA_END=278 /DNA_ORIENTATION=+
MVQKSSRAAPSMSSAEKADELRLMRLERHVRKLEAQNATLLAKVRMAVKEQMRRKAEAEAVSR